jgi:lysophospholipase L1-like esterase
MTTKPVILCFGDSNTHGTPPMVSINDLARFAQHERWPGVVRIQLGEQAHIIEEGQPGRTTLYDDPTAGGERNGMTALCISLESHRPIDYVVLMLGTNDLHTRFGLSAWVISLSIKKLIVKIQQMPCGPHNDVAPRILLVSPPPVIEQGFAAQALIGAAAKSLEFAQHFEMIARETGVEFMDAGKIISADPLDGIHFSAESHRVLGAAIATKLTHMMDNN